MEAGSVSHGAGLAMKWVLISISGLLVIIVLGSVLVPPVTRHWTDRWGATDAEVAMRLPGDAYVADPVAASTKAITIRAPAHTVYKLIRQMGYRRGGWFGWDWFYNMTGSSGFLESHHSRTIVPELQKLAVGDAIYINSFVGYRVVRDDIESAEQSASGPYALVLYGAWMSGSAKPDPLPLDRIDEADVRESWTWVVRPVDEDTSRLVLRIRSTAKEGGAFVQWLYDKPLDMGGAIMGRKTLVGIRDAAEGLESEGRP
jgi:hypothetical protein